MYIGYSRWVNSLTSHRVRSRAFELHLQPSENSEAELKYSLYPQSQQWPLAIPCVLGSLAIRYNVVGRTAAVAMTGGVVIHTHILQWKLSGYHPNQCICLGWVIQGVLCCLAFCSVPLKIPGVVHLRDVHGRLDLVPLAGFAVVNLAVNWAVALGMQ